MRFASLVERIAGERAEAWRLARAAREALERGEDVIDLSIGDPDFDTPGFVADAAVSALRGGDTHYVDPRGKPALRAAIAGHESRLLGLELTADQVIVTAGAQNALLTASLLLLDPGDEVIVPEPAYLTYEASIRASGAVLKLCPVAPGRGFRPDLDALARSIGAKTRAIFLATPNNPSGAVLDPGELGRLCELARVHDLWIVSDEVYGEIVFDRPHRSPMSEPGMAGRVVKLGSLSKSMAMTGWRIGWLVGPPALAAHAGRLAQAMHYGLQGFLQEGAVAALEHGAAHAEAMRLAYRKRRDTTAEALAPVPGLVPLVPEAGMFMLVDVVGTGMTSGAFADALFRETGVALLDAAPFGAALAGHVRISFAAADADLAEACRRISRFVAGLGRIAS